ncbi:fumarylacetoacetate hydrolase family protein [Micrococcales bacterium 31B]|nr:fumarylacetoacetate hydrolase family protein [Micrococcales bacterium 31B]
MHLTAAQILPADAENATLVGRVFDPEVAGPCVVTVDGADLVDISDLEPTVASLLQRPKPREVIARGLFSGKVTDAATGETRDRRRWPLDAVLAATVAGDALGARLLAPIDLQVIKAAGVTFVESMLERVIEERAKGDPAQASAVREHLTEAIGGAISSLTPGSPEAAAAKRILQREGLWSQYLEVGIGPDPEIFTKAPVLSAVGAGAQIGVLQRSVWNNPEPEVVLVASGAGEVVGATLGNDVNLRDFEGRSALLLAEAKDNNASCAIGPFVRLFDDDFDLDEVRALDVTLRVEGPDGFVLDGQSSMRNISRDPLELVRHTIGDHHQYPDGFVLFTGTLFAPTQDRHAPGAGFTHEVGDTVSISTPLLGALVNRVNHAESAPRWEFGIWALVQNLRARGLL